MTKKRMILLLVALFSFPAMAESPKLRGPNRSLSSRPRISSMKDRGKTHVRVRTDTKNRGSLYHRNRRGSFLGRNRSYKDYYYRTQQPIIVVVHVFPPPILKSKPSREIVSTSNHVTIFAQSTLSSKRFGSPIIFPKKSVVKSKP